MNIQQYNPRERSIRFVDYLFKHCRYDIAFSARLRRADNPATEYHCWDILTTFQVDLTCTNERIPFSLIAAAIARSEHKSNGIMLLGHAIAQLFNRKSGHNGQAKIRLRRLLACDDIEEVCLTLRPLLGLISNQVPHPLNYVSLLEELCGFHHSREWVKAHWAQQFYAEVHV